MDQIPRILTQTPKAFEIEGYLEADVWWYSERRRLSACERSELGRQKGPTERAGCWQGLILVPSDDWSVAHMRIASVVETVPRRPGMLCKNLC